MHALFETPRFYARALTQPDLPSLQALFEANPDYFVAVGGQPPRADEAQQEFNELPPPHLPFGARWFAGLFDGANVLRGIAIVVSDLSAPAVWHIALFFLEEGSRRTGASHEIYDALENWIRASGGSWIRLGVVHGNLPAERFWVKCGFTETRTREFVNASGQTKTVRVLVKSVTGGTIDSYLQLVPRDQPGSTLE